VTRPDRVPRHELPAIDEAALAAARAVDAAAAMARDGGLDRWARYLAPLTEPLRDGPLPEVRRAARAVRAAYGPKDSIRDALPPTATEPLLEATDRLLRALARREASRD
jgi:hypothetical protein